jgi:hypothetical protein
MALLMTGAPGGDPGIDLPGVFQSPPWSAAAEEKTVSDHAPFAVCEHLISTVVSKSNGKIKEQNYSVSETWGDVLRTKVTQTGDGSSFTADIICWSKPGSGAQIAVKIEDAEG